MMTERPILFSAPMVRALLAGTKTQTRRAVRVQPPPGTFQVSTWHHPDPRPHFFAWQELPHETAMIADDFAHPCPYGQPGDRLWVREAWGVADKWLHDCETNPPRCIAYRADLAARNFDPVYDVDTRGWTFAPHMKWRPSIHMHRWASRITLEVADVRVERLQDISKADARAEGIAYSERFVGYCIGQAEHFNSHDPRQSYFSLWEAINGPGSVEANPWVWVVAFKVVKV